MHDVQIRKPSREAFDTDLALTEAYNFRRVMELHLKRCDDLETATQIAEILNGLATGFQQKSLALANKVR